MGRAWWSQGGQGARAATWTGGAGWELFRCCSGDQAGETGLGLNGVIRDAFANAALRRRKPGFGGWAARVETTAEFAPALGDALSRNGIRLLHLVTDIEQLNAAGTTVGALRARQS